MILKVGQVWVERDVYPNPRSIEILKIIDDMVTFKHSWNDEITDSPLEQVLNIFKEGKLDILATARRLIEYNNEV